MVPAPHALFIAPFGLFDGSGSDALHDVPLDDHEEDHDGQGEDDGCCHLSAEVGAHAGCGERGEPHRQRVLGLVLHERVRGHVVVPCADEREHGRGHDAGRGQGEGDLPQDLPVVGPFDGRGLEDVLGDVEEEAAHVSDRERQDHGDVREDQAAVLVQQAELVEDEELWDDAARGHLDGQHEHHDRLAAAEPVEGQGRAREEREDDRQDDRYGGHNHAVLQVRQERRLGDGHHEVVDRQLRGPEHGRRGHDLVARLERRDEHPVDREDPHDAEHDGQHDRADAAQPRGKATLSARRGRGYGCGGHHRSSPDLSRYRMYTLVRASRMSVTSTLAAAPVPMSNDTNAFL